MKIEIDKTKKVMKIEVPLIEPRLSSTGKSKIIASSGGWLATTAQINNKPVKVNLVANIPA